MKRIKINRLTEYDTSPGQVLIKGWVRTRRDAKGFSFMEINDGSCLENIQVVADSQLSNYTDIQGITTGSAVAVTGELVPSPGKGQKWEIQAAGVEIISLAPETYPLQKKRHTDEFLRTIAHLRPRTNKYGAAFRIRSEMVQAIHRFYREKGFYCLTSPVITGSDCEGAGEMFRVTSLDPAQVAKQGKLDFSKDFFGQESNLTVSGQLSAEMFAQALGDVYTFGPTFRAENSNTSRHVAEFWMLEPEMAFCDLSGNMDHGEELVKYLVTHALDACDQDLGLFFKFVDKGLPKQLEILTSKTFERMSYTEAIRILEKSSKKFEYPVKFGIDLQSEHERFLAEEYVKKPVFLYDYPKTIKPFYMRINDDNTTVAAVDLLVPGIGELIGGSQREERLDVLESRMEEMGMDKEPYWWYLDSRRYGSVPHAGFGLGFERFLMMITGIKNIRDVVPFPRTPGSIDF
ncbi:asparagine--tRNA ligase [Desulfotignum phosphitoxidans]|uniref:Asparagine--tRNA ligase n=1 Tax=Desulfotignum phosphitoxidans DSM 13687 TaxID=1286635 RepID=S0G185_9BACT|nr:asparagine--tRNA ligase [Desulfotignum phosphitoxidans]EMS77471.1 asparaginyl-tRNA synthetase AsnS [Desulfotignum phosphitoxidans DSM 13687]